MSRHGAKAFRIIPDMQITSVRKPLLLFAYGSLLGGHTGDRCVDRLLAGRLVLRCRAWTWGRLYQVRGYPVLLPAAGRHPAQRVHGAILQGRLSDAELRCLDRYEGFDPARPHAGIYVRGMITAHCLPHGRPLRCQCYLGIRPGGRRLAVCPTRKSIAHAIDLT